MDDLRLALVLCGVLLVAAIYLWETKLRKRRRRERRDDAGLLCGTEDRRERRGYGFSIGEEQEPVHRPELDEPGEIITAFPITEDTTEPTVGEEPREMPIMPTDDETLAMSASEETPASQEIPVVRADDKVDDLGESVAELESLLSDLPVSDELPADALLAANAELQTREAQDRRSPREELVVALTVMARHGQSMSGAELRSALEAEGLRYGDMQIFHHYGDNGDTPEPLFSVANAVKPGTFELDSLDSLETPGLALFARVPETRGTARFDLMLSKAEHLARQLDADVCDDGRCTLTKQSANHIRERIVEYERRQRLS